MLVCVAVSSGGCVCVAVSSGGGVCSSKLMVVVCV